ncbi:hypothetical protein [Mucilaginibacter aquaedulcis]|uniref:hypothetical protein n=1 Tax=Mucilaginibacter aquaedulcis TaxID=1187081 RepID=UPI0025B5B99F|nr:hypothetical protein [Mucilaginibacter aquaedulcis]MDN3548759.1 hypothetical protein [Mucilaginibacter aquaedulcis]
MAASEGKKQNGEAEKAVLGGHANGVKERGFSENWSSHEQYISLGMPGLAQVFVGSGLGAASH